MSFSNESLKYQQKLIGRKNQENNLILFSLHNFSLFIKISLKVFQKYLQKSYYKIKYA